MNASTFFKNFRNVLSPAQKLSARTIRKSVCCAAGAACAAHLLLHGSGAPLIPCGTRCFVRKRPRSVFCTVWLSCYTRSNILI